MNSYQVPETLRTIFFDPVHAARKASFHFAWQIERLLRDQGIYCLGTCSEPVYVPIKATFSFQLNDLTMKWEEFLDLFVQPALASCVAQIMAIPGRGSNVAFVDLSWEIVHHDVIHMHATDNGVFVRLSQDYVMARDEWIANFECGVALVRLEVPKDYGK